MMSAETVGSGQPVASGERVLSKGVENRMTAFRLLRFKADRTLRHGLGMLVLTCIAGSSALCQAAPAAKADAVLLATPPRSWAVDATTNELKALHHRGSYLRYRMHIVNDKGDMTRDIIESQDGTVARLILRNGRPLTADDDRDERQRLNDLIAHPAEYAKHIRDEDSSGRKIGDQLIRLMPDAMIYTYTPGQPQSGKGVGPEVVMDFKPNPAFKPPTITAEALQGLEGRVWVDAKTHYVVHMEGTIFRAVNFGWGVVAHIYPGGSLALDQTDAGGGRWIFTHFTEDVKVRALMVKTVHLHEQVDTSDYRVVHGPITYQQAIRMLLDTPLPSR
jgi:hypothetical protein